MDLFSLCKVLLGTIMISYWLGEGISDGKAYETEWLETKISQLLLEKFNEKF